MNQSKLLLAMVVFISMVLFTHLSHATVAVNFNQVDFYQDGVLSTPNSEWGEFNVSYDQGSSLQWINVVADPGTPNARWIVQNNPLLPSSMTGTSLFNGTSYFDLGVSRGTDISALNIGYIVSSTPASSIPTSFNATESASVGTSQNVINNGAADGSTTLGSPSNGNLNWGVSYLGVTAHWQMNMPNVAQKKNYCVPGAAANSLQWLNKSHNLGITQTVTETMNDLAGKMGTTTTVGTYDTNFVAGKLNYISSNKLPLEVHYVGGGATLQKGDYTDPTSKTVARNDGAVTWDWIQKEKMKGQDIELWSKGHVVVMEGFISWDNIHLIAYRDDPYQHGVNTTADELAKLASRHVWTYYIDGDTNLGNGKAKLHLAVAESAVPEPGTMLLVGIGLAGIGYLRMRGAKQ